MNVLDYIEMPFF